MALNIKDPTIHALARELAQATGESLAQTVRLAYRNASAVSARSRLHLSGLS